MTQEMMMMKTPSMMTTVTMMMMMTPMMMIMRTPTMALKKIVQFKFLSLCPMPLTLWPALHENLASHPLEPKCANPTLSMALTPRSCTPSWCNGWPLNGLSQTFYLLEILDPIPCGWTTGLSFSSSSSQPSAPTTQLLTPRTSSITFK
ncbi:hypothetical protein ID866_11969 [Astraeus odoratus]|nr:hypothetical protein ID866_11969 [Astraeus odoratus]